MVGLTIQTFMDVKKKKQYTELGCILSSRTKSVISVPRYGLPTLSVFFGDTPEK